MKQRKIVTTGIEGLDLFLQGGLPEGYTTLLLAPAGGGAEIFAKQFATGDNEPAVYVSTDESVDEVKGAVKDAGWEFKNVVIDDIQSDFARAMLESQGPEEDRSGGFDPRALVEGTASFDVLSGRGKRSRSDYLGRLIQPFEQKNKPKRLIIHSLDFFLSLYSIDKVAAVLTALKAANAATGGQLLLVAAKGAHGEKVERRLELLADCLIEMEVNRRGTMFERFFLVKKVKNRPNAVGVSTYTLATDGISLETLERIV